MKHNLLFVLSIIISTVSMAQKASNLPVIPLPAKMEVKKGYFEMVANTMLIAETDKELNDLTLFQSYVTSKYNLNLKVSTGGQKKRSLFVKRNLSLKAEGYKLTVDSMGITIEGGERAGVFYGLQTLMQLLPAGKTDRLSIPLVTIEDEPRFSWRGMHLDVCRHFFGVEEVKKYIDYLAMYKLNTFHWHLTDDQGWRIEIKKYPRLTSVAAWRKGTLIGHYGEEVPRYDTIRYGGFYTQEQIKEVVAYAAERYINVVPEIEMPGHALAALAAYPMLACTEGPFEVGKTWGVFNDVYCPREETFNFLQDVLAEVCELFPGQYIHIGGDECPKDRWKESAFCQALMKKENLKNEHELQSYFVQRIGRFLQSKGKKMIGWDEILEGGIAEDATIMSWRGYAGGIEAAKQHHDVVMTPTAYCYFDYYQSRGQNEPLAIGGYLPLSMVYRFEPIADVMTSDDAKYVLGTQGNLWTEYIDNWKKVEYMVMPRMAALAEVAWTPRDKKDYAYFATRLGTHSKLLDFLKINYSHAFYDISARVTPAGNNGINIDLISDFPDAKIRYTTDGKNPTGESRPWESKMTVDQSMFLKAAVFNGMNRVGNITEERFAVNYATGKEVTLTNQPHEEYAKGGAFSLVDGRKGTLPWNGNDWLGFTGKPFEAVVDLGVSRSILNAGIDVLSDSSSWIYPPSSVEIFISDNNVDFKSIGKLDASKIKAMGRKLSISGGKVSARYVKFVAQTAGVIQAGALGAGNESWLMIDEIEVN
jgi:hexosaminidase